MCPGPRMEVGEQYVMYTYFDGTGYLTAGGCTRSSHVRYAEEDLRFLNGVASAPPTGTVLGEVTVRRGGIYTTGVPASGVAVEILGRGIHRTSTSDGDGHFSFSGLKPGEYSVNALQPEFKQSQKESTRTAKVTARACAAVDLVLRKEGNGVIAGHVFRADGTPAQAGITMELTRLERRGEQERWELLIGFSVLTDGKGEYSFRGLLPGIYKVALNQFVAPSPQNPYPTMYWPGTKSEQTAGKVEISGNLASQQCDFYLPTALRSRPVTITVLLPDGRPAKGAHANIGMDGGFVWAGQVVTDASGQFSFGAMEGFDYEVQDILTHDAMMSPRYVHFSMADGSQPVVIRLVPKTY